MLRHGKVPYGTIQRQNMELFYDKTRFTRPTNMEEDDIRRISEQNNLKNLVVSQVSVGDGL